MVSMRLSRLQGEFFQFLQLEAQLRLIQPFTSAATKQLLRQPGDLRAQCLSSSISSALDVA
jgi:hypothetical protein